jgi:hypothetical protein
MPTAPPREPEKKFWRTGFDLVGGVVVVFEEWVRRGAANGEGRGRKVRE